MDEHFECQLDESLLEEDQGSLEEVASASCNHCAAFSVEAVNHHNEIHLKFFCWRNGREPPKIIQQFETAFIFIQISARLVSRTK